MTGPTVFAHRGFAGAFPENTVAAARGAVALGADAVELDVQPTADGDVVVFHDRRLDGLTDGRGVVWEQSTATVTEARVLDTEACVPLLADVLDAIPDGVTVNLELKNPGSDAVRTGKALSGAARDTARERWTPFVESVLSVVTAFHHDVLYASFCAGALAALDTVGSDERVAALVAPDCAEAGTTTARRYGVDAIHPPVDQLSGDILAVASELDADCNAWTVRDWRDARTALRAGADGIIADYPGLDAYL